MTDSPTGYRHRAYAESFCDYGDAVPLLGAGGWLLKRAIPGSDLCDAMGCYPLLCCSRWSPLSEDLERLHDEAISVSAVADPFGDYSLEDLERSFDLVRPFKEHFVVDLGIPQPERLNAHHRREVRRSAKLVSVERCAEPSTLLDEWAGLYDGLIRRHRVRGLAAFSRQAFERQFEVPGLVAYRADSGNELCGMALWYLAGEVCYYHLAAYTDGGYRNSASYALVATALDQLASAGIKWANLGAGAGLSGVSDGLSLFKKGWSTGTRIAYFCGRILDQDAYESLAQAAGKQTESYFPAYRAGEFS